MLFIDRPKATESNGYLRTTTITNNQQPASPTHFYISIISILHVPSNHKPTKFNPPSPPKHTSHTYNSPPKPHKPTPSSP